MPGSSLIFDTNAFIWIAALALQHGLPLLTRDAHFREVEGLNVLGW